MSRCVISSDTEVNHNFGKGIEFKETFVANQTSRESNSRSPKRVYLGISKNGLLEINVDGQLVLFSGSVYSVTKKASSGASKRKRKLLHSTPESVKTTQPPQSFLCPGSVGSSDYRIIGTPLPASGSEMHAGEITPPNSAGLSPTPCG